MSSVLVVDDDVDIARFIELNLKLEGFEVHVAYDGEEALGIIEKGQPDLVLLDVMMPKIDGVELCRRLRADPATSNLSVIMLTAKTLSADKVVGLTAGADDYIIKPFDTLELVARVRSTLRRNSEMRAISPLTGLAGNTRIEDEIGRRVDSGRPFAVCYLDLDNFKAFNDAYGFLRGDDMILLLSAVLKEIAAAAADRGEPVPFVGHVGGDDFVLVCQPAQAEPMCRQALAAFDAAAPQLHDPRDAARGYLSVIDRKGAERRYPLVSVSAGIATTERRSFTDRREVVAVATEMKAVAKGADGSAIAVDRRADR